MTPTTISRSIPFRRAVAELKRRQTETQKTAYLGLLRRWCGAEFAERVASRADASMSSRIET